MLRLESLPHLETNCTESIMVLKRKKKKKNGNEKKNFLGHLKHLQEISNLVFNGLQMDNLIPGCMIYYYSWGQTTFSGRVSLASDSENFYRY